MDGNGGEGSSLGEKERVRDARVHAVHLWMRTYEERKMWVGNCWR